MKKREQLKGSERRGVGSAEQAGPWLEERGLEDIECIVPDMAGVARGKMMPVGKFVAAQKWRCPALSFSRRSPANIRIMMKASRLTLPMAIFTYAGLFDIVGRAVGIRPNGASDP